MAVIVFGNAPTVYHYPPTDNQPDKEITRCGIKAEAEKKRTVFRLENEVPSHWQPCDKCSEMDDRDQRFVGTF